MTAYSIQRLIILTYLFAVNLVQLLSVALVLVAYFNIRGICM